MQLQKDTNNLSYTGFTDAKDRNNTMYFDNGHLEASAYSYEIGGTGSIQLDEEQTYEIYLFMKEFYEKSNR